MMHTRRRAVAGTNRLFDAATLSAAFRSKVPISDGQFDLLFPASQRFRSYSHWTPIDVAIRASALLALRPDQRVLDVGCGVGKVCLVGALTTSAMWVGIETEPEMVCAAAQAARLLGVTDRACFVQGDATAIDWVGFDAIYMFNPFVEGLFKGGDGPVARHERYMHNIERVRARLAGMHLGTRLVTYHGFGGDAPDGFELVHDEAAGQDRLSLWCRCR